MLARGRPEGQQPINVLPLPIEEVHLVAIIQYTSISTKQHNHRIISAENVSYIEIVT